MASVMIRRGSFSQVELGGLEPPTPCLQSDVFSRVSGLDLGNRLSLSDRYVPLRTGGNGTLMARLLVWPVRGQRRSEASTPASQPRARPRVRSGRSACAMCEQPGVCSAGSE